MLRYFIAWNLWLAAAFTILLGSGYARRAPAAYTIFNVGWINPVCYWLIVIASFALSIFHLTAWLRPTNKPRPVARGFEVITTGDTRQSVVSSGNRE